ncbi:uncharacterized, partial [Tachysurus ichikawai]
AESERPPCPHRGSSGREQLHTALDRWRQHGRLASPRLRSHIGELQ